MPEDGAAHGGLRHPTGISNLENAPTNMPTDQSDEDNPSTEVSSSHVCQADNQPELAVLTRSSSIWIWMAIETEERGKGGGARKG